MFQFSGMCSLLMSSAPTDQITLSCSPPNQDLTRSEKLAHPFTKVCKNQDMLQISRWLGRFGASARRNDGKQDGGDALELTVRVKDEPKSEVMRELARQLVSEVREAVESAAHRGEQPPQWVQAFMSKAGWEHYHQLREEAGHSDQAITEPAPHIGGSLVFLRPTMTPR
jgi:hypothetical protein